MSVRGLVLLVGVGLLALGLMALDSFTRTPEPGGQMNLPPRATVARGQPMIPQVSVQRPPSLPERMQRIEGIRLQRLWPFGIHRPGPEGLGAYLTSLVFVLGAGALSMFLLPARLASMASGLQGSWRRLLVLFALGLLGYAGLAALAFLATTTVVGIPAALLIGLLLYLATAISLVVAAMVLGKRLGVLAKVPDRSPIYDMVIGLLILFAMAIVPIAGWLAIAVLACLGLGSLLATRIGADAGWSLQELDYY